LDASNAHNCNCKSRDNDSTKPSEFHVADSLA